MTASRLKTAIRLGVLLLLTLPSGLVGRASPPPAGPVAAWAFAEATGTTAADMTGNGHTATLVNGVAWTPAGKFGAALHFDGTDDVVTVADHAALDATSAFGVTLWVAPDELGGTTPQGVLSKTGSGGPAFDLSITADGYASIVAYTATGSVSASSLSVVPADDWTHVAVTATGSNLRVFIDGVMETQVPLSAALRVTEGPLQLGNYSGAPFEGRLDEVRFYDRALDETEMLTDMYTPVDASGPLDVTLQEPPPASKVLTTTLIEVGFSRAVVATSVTTNTLQLLDASQQAVSASVAYDATQHKATITPTNPLGAGATYSVVVHDGPSGVLPVAGDPLEADVEWSFMVAAPAGAAVASWGLDQTTGLTTPDASGNGNTGALVNGATWTTAGKFGGALAFDGSNDVVMVPDSPTLSPRTAITLSVWVSPATQQAQMLLSKETPKSTAFDLGLKNSGPVYLLLRPNNAMLELSGTSVVPLNQWTHLAATYDGSTIRVYVNGVEEVTQSATGLLRDNGAPLRIGSLPASQRFHGTLDEIRIFDRALNPAEIQAAMDDPINDGPPPGEDPPPDPSTVAPTLSGIMLTDFVEANDFLFEGANPIQRGHTAGSIEDHRFAIVRGKVLTREGLPLSGARVSSPEQPTVGYTVSRADGMFDLAVNGGGPVLLEYTRNGFLPSQRVVDTPWQDFAWAPDVRLVMFDTAVTTVSMGPQTDPLFARGSVVTDADGTRRTTLIIPEGGVMATIHLPDNTYLPAVSQLSIRATEYTVGAGGPESMPGPLPATSGYTYAVELSADEALQANATRVTFDPPLVSYVENFLDFPVGGIVPTGYYDRQQSVWIAADNGRIVEILSVNGSGQAELDIDGSAQPANTAALTALGVTAGERRRLATLYAVGQSLWRTPIPHFSPWDHNWPGGPSSTAQGPGFAPPPADPEGSRRRIGLRRHASGEVADPCPGGGSVIDCENQTLGEVLPIAGTSFALTYRSNRTPGADGSRIEIPVTGAVVPPDLKRVDVEILVSGQRERRTFTGAPGQSTSFIWDGLDPYGRPQTGAQGVQVKIAYVYDAVYYAPAVFPQSFGNISPGTEVVADEAREEISLIQRLRYMVGVLTPQATAVSGWDLDVHHRYDWRSQTLHLGTGDQRTAASIGDIMSTIAGGGEVPVETEPVDGALSALQSPIGAVAAAANGLVYFVDGNGILSRTRDGVVRRLKTFNPAVNEDARPALAAAPDGSVYFTAGTLTDNCSSGGVYTAVVVKRLSANGAVTQATSALDLLLPTDCSTPPVLALGSDGAFFVAAGTWLYHSYRGGSSWEPVMGNDDPVLSLAADRDGGVYLGFSGRVRRWRPDGSAAIVAGTGQFGFSGDGGPALLAQLGQIRAMTVNAQGHLFIVDSSTSDSVVRVIGADGTIRSQVGGGAADEPLAEADGALAGAARLRLVFGVTFSPDGDLYVTENGAQGGGEDNDFACGDADMMQAGTGPRVRRIIPALTRDAIAGLIQVPSADGGAVYEFDTRGVHQRTVDALTGVTLYTFGHDAAGRLLHIDDRDGLRTLIQRSAEGVPTAITGPFGAVTTLAVTNGYLTQVVDPEENETTLSYTSTGLLTGLSDANGGAYIFDYNGNGRLVRDRGPAEGDQTLTRTDSQDGWTLTRTIADAGTTSYVTEQLAEGGQQRTVIAPDGTATVSVNAGTGVTTTTAPDGTVTTSTQGPDPRFAFAAPIARETRIVTPSGLTMTLQRTRSITLSDPADLLSLETSTDTTSVNSLASQSTFDAATRTVTSTSPMGRQTVTSLDTQGRPTGVQVGVLLPTTLVYDAFGRVTSQSQGSRTTTFTYDTGGYTATVTDPLSRTVTFTNDQIGRGIEQTLPDLRMAEFGYDGNSNLTSLTPPGRPAHQMAYTPVNLLEEYSAPLVDTPTVTQYEFNRAKQPTLVTRADGQELTWTYDTAGRLTALATPTGSTTYAYHGTTGQLTTVTSPQATLTYVYDGSLQTSETFAGAVAGAVAWDYDAFFRVSTERVLGGNGVAFTYDHDGLLQQAGGVTYDRDTANGLLTSATLDSTETTFEYNGFGELISELTAANGTTLYQGVYTRDAGGRLAAKGETIGGALAHEVYGYDLAGRLTTVTRNGVVEGQYAYDSNGNRTSVTTPGGTTTATYDAQDRILTFGARTYTHNADGEVSSWSESGATTTLTYDSQGNLLGVGLPTGNAVTYVVDGLNRRIRRLVNSAATHGYLYQGLRPVAELDGAGDLVTRFVYGARAVAPEYMIRGGVTYRLVADNMGSVRLVVDVATGNIAQRLDYDAWGVVVTDTYEGFQPFGYAGGFYDPMTGLIRFGARDYDASIGRWTTKDPIGFEGGDTNLYSYVGNAPIDLIDPTGLDWLSTLADYSAGFGDSISLGLTGHIRQAFDIDAVDRCSTAYLAGVATELVLEIAASGGSVALRSAAKGIAQSTARSGMKSHGVKNISAMHHVNPLKSGLFPTAALPDAIKHHKRNLKLLSLAEHTAAHARLAKQEAFVAGAFNPTTTGARVAMGFGRLCKCQ